ncbi:MAG: hypothetical protein KIT17_06275 [Rubrivivax sp.]|nr:hypothetical protein [Rubrivivax sp.]
MKHSARGTVQRGATKGQGGVVKRLSRRGAARVIAEQRAPADASEGFVEHPDGWYWLSPDGHQQFGPFETCSLARADRDRASEEAVNEAEAERQAEQALGVEQAVHEQAAAPIDGDDMPDEVEGHQR